jgi:hypothetical protein
MDDKATLTKRLDRLAEVLTGTTNFSCYAHTVYEANAELDRQAAQIAMLRERSAELTIPINTKTDDETFNEVRGHLLLTTEMDDRHQAMAFRDFVPGLLKYADKKRQPAQADVAAFEKQRRDAVLEEAIETLSNCQFITDDPRRDQRDYAMFLSTKKAVR